MEAVADDFIAESGSIRPSGDTPHERIASLARNLRSRLLEEPELVALVHDQSRTPSVFRPVQAAVAAELAAVRVTGKDAALIIRALEMHVVASVVLARTLERFGRVPPDQPLGGDDRELTDALSVLTDLDEVFEFGLEALLMRIAPNG
jgi:hypothetical protein